MPSAAFPPTSPSVQTYTIPSYLYQQYSDDDDLQGFITAYNGMTQTYVDWFVNAGLPVYTQLQGTLLDWIAGGVYGITRPTLGTPSTGGTGPINTTLINSQVINGYSAGTAGSYYLASDDVFQRIITWHTYKDDGKVFSLSWLKRRVLRFLYGVNGTSDGIPNNQISFSVAPESGAVLSLVPPDGPTIDFATGNGTTTVFNAGNTYYPNNKIYKNDWQGNQLQYSTPRTNLILDSEDIGGASWLGTPTIALTSTQVGTSGPYYYSLTKTKNTNSEATVQYQTGLPVIANDTLTLTISLRADSSSNIGVGILGGTSGFGSNANSTAVIISGPGLLTQNVGSLWNLTGLSTTQDTLLYINRICSVSESENDIYIYPGGTSSTTIGDSILMTRVMYTHNLTVQGSYIPTTTAAVTQTDYSSAETGIIADTSGVSITISTYNVTINVSAISNVSASILQAFHDAVASSALELPPQFAFSVTL